MFKIRVRITYGELLDPSPGGPVCRCGK
jgi:hypothetical protein